MNLHSEIMENAARNSADAFLLRRKLESVRWALNNLLNEVLQSQTAMESTTPLAREHARKALDN